MEAEDDLLQWTRKEGNEYLSHISLDCVVFGFHANQLKVLLLKMKHLDQLALPGGFLLPEETLEEAAIRVLRERTGLEDIFLQQFHVFSDPGRAEGNKRCEELKAIGFHPEKAAWFAQRFLSVGFYALVDFSLVDPKPDALSDSCGWHNLDGALGLVLDHDQIFQAALHAVRAQLNYQPVGYNLLPKKFTMPELQRLYETILDKPLDRRNFQRKIFSYGILRRLDEKRTGVAHKAPSLYSFDLRKYQKALKQGLEGGW